MLPRISWETGGAPLAILVVAAALVSYLYYKKTRPPTGPGPRIVLFLLRLAVLFLIGMLLFDPKIVFTRQHSEKAVIPVLIDVSESMLFPADKSAASIEINQIFSSENWHRFEKKHQIDFFRFADSLRVGFNSHMVFDGNSTNIGGSLRQISNLYGGKNVAALILVTDGNDNSGPDPVNVARTFPFPVYTVGVGDSSASKDIIMTGITSSERSMAGHNVPVRFKLRGPGFENKTVNVKLITGGQVVDSVDVVIPANGFGIGGELFFKADKSGFQKVRVEADLLDQEAVNGNNGRSCFVQITPGKIKVLLAATAPHPDAGLIHRLLDVDPDFEIIVRTLKTSSIFYEGDWLDEKELDAIDVVILNDFPGENVDLQLWQRIVSWIKRRHIPLFCISGIEQDLPGLMDLEAQLPYAQLLSGMTPVNRQLRTEKSGMYSSIVPIALRDNQFELPPLTIRHRISRLKPGAFVLAADENGNPVYMGYSFAKNRSLALLGTDFFRWKLYETANKPNRSIIGELLKNALHWLSTPGDDELIKLNIAEHLLEEGQNVLFTATVLNQMHVPQDQVKAVLTLKKDRVKIIKPMAAKEPGLYECTVANPGRGQWKAILNVYKKGLPPGQDTTEFLITPYRAELDKVNSNPGKLREISRFTAGENIQLAELDSFITTINFPGQVVEKENRVDLNNSRVVIILILLLLGAEWWYRKKRGMV